MIFDVLRPAGTESSNEVDSFKEDSKAITAQQINDKRSLLTSYITNSNSNDKQFNDILDKYPDTVPYSVMEAMNYCESNISLFPMINSLFNNVSYYYRKDMGAYLLQYAKNNNPLGCTFTKSTVYSNNPYYEQGVSNSEFNSIWKEVRRKYPTIKNDDKNEILTVYPTIEDLKYAIGYNTDQSKSKITSNDNDTSIPPKIDLSTPTTKADLYRYYYNLSLLYSNYNDNIFGNITSNNGANLLSDIRCLFVSLYCNKEDLQYRLALYGTDYGKWVYSVIGNYLQLPDDKYLVTSICLSPSNTSNMVLESSLINIFNRILTVLPKNLVIVPVDVNTCRFFGADNIVTTSFYKYNKHLVSNALISNSESSYKELVDVINGTTKKVSVKRCNTYNTNDIINRLKNSDNDGAASISSDKTIDPISTLNDTTSTIMKEVALSSFQHSNKEYTNQEFQQILSTLDHYNIIHIGRTIVPHKDGGAAMNGTPYIVMRKDKDKRFYYLNPSITIAYSTNDDYKVEEPESRLYCLNNVPLKDIYSIKKQCTNQITDKNLVFYNTDFAYSTYIASEIRNRQHYEEGNNGPRILVMDFETETGALRVRDNSTSIDARCRLISLFDIMDKKFYCAVLKDPQHHSNVDLSNFTEHDGYSVAIDEFYNESDLWYWLVDKFNTIDPDIITGWNVERFDLTYAIVRCKTLGIDFRSKYGPFSILYSKDANGRTTYSIGADGLVVIDYQKLYRACQFIKRENYKLEYICQIELKRGKRELIVDNHDQMYYQYLREYIMYNIEDDERILDLENKLNYLKFQYEMCRVCNVSWNDIFSKTKLIDGLVYNHAYDTNHTFLKERNVVDKNNMNLKNILSRDIQQYISASGDTSILLSDTSNNNPSNDINRFNDSNDYETLDITDYAIEEETEINDKGYEGAVVLQPQKGVKEVVADLDASQMYPRLMIRSNIFKDTLCGIIAIDNEKYAEMWLYNRDTFPKEILIKRFNTGNDIVVKMSKEEFEVFLKDKILTPFGTIYWQPSVKRSLVSDILITLIANRSKYKKLRDEVTEKYSIAKESNDTTTMNDCAKLMDRYENLQTAYKSLINSFYGVMGMMMYRLSDMFSAASITASGRELTRMVAYYGSKYMDTMIKEKRADVPFDHVPIDCKTLIGMENIENRKNILYGDTDSVFVHIGTVVNGIYGTNISMDDKLEHGWQIIDKVADYINDYVIRDILTRKNINFDDDDKKYNYQFKKELVMSKILFGTQKKHYAMHLAIKEGKRLDKIVIKGMLAIKSDTPRYSRNLLNNLTEYILKDYDANDVSRSNQEMLHRYHTAINDINPLIDRGDVAVARPVSLTQDIQHYSTIQAHIRGMLLYDIIYNHEFQFMDKAYQFYVTSIDFTKLNITEQEILNRFKQKYGRMKWYDSMMRTYKKDVFFSSVCVPTDKEFLDTSIFTVDRDKTQKTVIKEKVEDLMKLVGINILDESDRVKVKRNAVRKFSFDNFNNGSMFSV